MKNVLMEDSGLNKISENLAKVLVASFNFAALRKSSMLNAQDLFMAILATPNVLAAKLLERLGMDLSQTLARMQNRIQVALKDKQNQKETTVSFGEEARQLLSLTFLIASDLGHVYVGTEHLLLAIMKQEQYDFVKDLAGTNLSYENIKQGLLSFGVYQPGVFAKANEGEVENDESQNMLGFFTKDMNKMAKEGKYLKVWGRDQEIERIIHILARRTKNNALLIGEAGVGKTAIVEGLTQRIAKGLVPHSFRNKKIVQLDISSIIAGSKIRGDVEERLLGIISEMADNPDIIIFIDEIHMIVGAGTAGSGSTMDVANIIKPYLTNGDLRVIGSTTFDEYQKYIEEDDALARRFQTVFVDEINKEDAKAVLTMLREQFESFHHVKITDEALVEAVELSDRYITSKYLPDKAIDVIDEAGAAKKIAGDTKPDDSYEVERQLELTVKNKDKAMLNDDIVKAGKLREKEKGLRAELKKLRLKKPSSKKRIVDVEDIKKVVSKWSGVPIQSIKKDDLKRLVDLEKTIKKSIIGQDDVIKQVAAALKRARIGLGDANRPLASFLFLGPTGVGKTQTAKEIAKILFGSEDNLIQVDMSEYMESHSISKLIGSPPGYVGFQEGGQLTEKIRRKPYSVVLFDEIEKAHPDLINVLLQILDEGRLQDAKGRVVNFKNTVVVMTSNLGAWESSDVSNIGFALSESKGKVDEEGYDKMKENLLEVLKDNLPPEFINRIDEVLIYRKLNEEDAIKIVQLFTDEVVERLKARNIVLDIKPAVLKYIVKNGFDTAYGARNLKRKVQELLENDLADYLMGKRIVNKLASEQTITVDIVKDKINFSQ